jgi:uncharacterized membrane protein YqgA involved in biofilm formation
LLGTLVNTATVIIGSAIGLTIDPRLPARLEITLLAAQLLFLSEPAVSNAVNTTGGILILGIGINLLELGHVPVGNLPPALLCAIIGALVL